MSRLRIAGYIGIAFSLGVILTLQLVGWAFLRGKEAGVLQCVANVEDYSYANGLEDSLLAAVNTFCLEER